MPSSKHPRTSTIMCLIHEQLRAHSIPQENFNEVKGGQMKCRKCVCPKCLSTCWPGKECDRRVCLPLRCSDLFCAPLRLMMSRIPTTKVWCRCRWCGLSNDFVPSPASTRLPALRLGQHAGPLYRLNSTFYNETKGINRTPSAMISSVLHAENALPCPTAQHQELN
jgi:hypothetical protein